MHYNQKKHSNRTSLRFSDDTLDYCIKEASNTTSFSVDYEEIPFQASYYEERNVWFRNAGYFWLLLGAVITIHKISSEQSFFPSIWIFVGVGCIIAYYFFTTAYSVFDTSKGRIFIIKDSQHETIVKEIDDRRKACIRQRYGHIDFSNDPEREAQRQLWLFEHNIISQIEYSDAIAKLASNHD